MYNFVFINGVFPFLENQMTRRRYSSGFHDLDDMDRYDTRVSLGFVTHEADYICSNLPEVGREL